MCCCVSVTNNYAMWKISKLNEAAYMFIKIVSMYKYNVDVNNLSKPMIRKLI